MRRYLVLSIVTFLPLSCGPFSNRADPLLYAAAPLHGGFPYSAETRERIARNRRVLGEIAAALAGKRRWPDWFSPTQGLWWLAESGRAEYLPLFLRYSDPAGPRWPVGARRDCLGCHPGDVTTYAAYGLARHAARPEATRRLRELLAARTDTHSTRYNVVTLLAVVNDTATRVLLREISRDRSTERARAWPLWEDALRRADSALATPALLPGHGRVPPLRPVASLQVLVPDARTAIEAGYERLADAIRRNDVEGILAIQAPGFSSINHRGMTSDYVAMERYTRQMTAAVDSVIHIRNVIRTFEQHGDTAVADVCQEFSRVQRIGEGQPRRVDTSVLQRETWVREDGRWRRFRVENVRGMRWFVDGVRVDPSQPYTDGMPAYAPELDPPTGCGLR